MIKHRLWSTVLFLGFGAYLFLCVGLQILLFRQYASGFQGVGHISFVPFAALLGALNGSVHGQQMPILMWIELACLMVPFGFCLFLWVDDCTSFRSIAAITLGFNGILGVTNYLLTAPVFDIEFIVSSLIGSFLGYVIAVGCVEMLFSKRMQPLLAMPAKPHRKAA